MTEETETKSKNAPSPLTPLKAGYRIAALLQRVPEPKRASVLQDAAAEVGIEIGVLD